MEGMGAVSEIWGGEGMPNKQERERIKSHKFGGVEDLFMVCVMLQIAEKMVLLLPTLFLIIK